MQLPFRAGGRDGAHKGSGGICGRGTLIASGRRLRRDILQFMTKWAVAAVMAVGICVTGSACAQEKAGKDRRMHVFVSGKVQGVSFRAFVQKEAEALGVQGWVKNLADGRVEAVAEGPKEKVDALLEKMKKGPATARVEKMEVAEEAATGEFAKFEVKY
jgi:acylphosphatase